MDLDKAKKPFFNLMMFPYPSGEGLHVGNMYAFTGADIHGRFQRMMGNDVFEPIGLDGFGIHSENYALKLGKHPAEVAQKTEKTFYRQLEATGNAYAWKNTLETYHPDYYKWTQWIFIQLFEAGLVERKKASVNWCPSCKTTLSDEQVISGQCERCKNEVEKKELEQWFFKITKYADKLLKNLEWIDWSERTKIAQRNWIGKSEGAEIKFQVFGSELQIPTFTTRPDTIFGATFFVLAPESKWVEKLTSPENKEKVSKYIKRARKKTEIQRLFTEREKTGVFTGGYVINPATERKIPVWVADYVVMGYGTGAVMGVPAHDERDFEFAVKYDLPIVQTVAPDLAGFKKTIETLEVFDQISNEARKSKLNFWVLGGLACAFYARIIYRAHSDLDLIVQDTESLHKINQILNKLGFKKVKEKKLSKKLTNLIFKNKEEIEIEVGLDLREFGLKESDFEEKVKELNGFNALVLSKRYVKSFKEKQLKERGYNRDRVDLEYLNGQVFEGKGKLVNSGQFDGLSVEKGIKEITVWLEKKGVAKKQTQYRLRDWCVSRQRYWGPPIPMINCPQCGWQPVPEKDLPVKLPFVKNYQPKGISQSPLAQAKDWVKVKCPKCDGPAERETDVSDTFLDSAWYFFRYSSTDKKDKAFDKLRVKKWLPVEMYIGGQEHAVLHLMYARFLTMVFKDLGLIDFEEPFKRFYAHGLLIKDGAKMSKSRGNVIIPDKYIKKFGADTLRCYLMFLGPFDQGGDFRDKGIAGMYRFLGRVWKIGQKFEQKGTSEEKKVIHRTIKKVTEDIQNLRYNIAIAAIMEFVNFLYKEKSVSRQAIEVLAQLLAPFAPHISEEIWCEVLGNKFSVHQQPWPKYDSKLIEEEKIIIVIQVNGKLRGQVEVQRAKSKNQKEIENLAKKEKNVAKYLNKKKIKKVVFVPGRLINFVV